MRAARTLLLTLIAALLTCGLLVGQVGVANRLSVLSPRFIVGTLDRLDLYDEIIDAAVAAATPPAGSASFTSAMIIMSAARKSLSPQLVRQTLYEALAGAERLIKDPNAPPRLDVDLTPLREVFVAALTQAGQDLQATPSQLRQIEAQIMEQFPGSVDLVELLELLELSASFPAFARAYSVAARRLMIALAGVLLLTLLLVTVGRRAWRPWLSAPLLISGSAVMGFPILSLRLGLPLVARAVDLDRVLPPTVDASIVMDALYGVGTAVLRVFGAVGVFSFAAGCAVLLLHRRTERAQAANLV